MNGIVGNRYSVFVDGRRVAGCQKVTIPYTTSENAEVGDTEARNVNIAAGETTSDLVLENVYLQSPEDDDFFDVWREQVRIAVPDTYKRMIEITLNRPDGTPIKGWRCRGCYPSEVQPGELDVKGTDALRITVTIKVDNVERMEL